MTTSRWVQSCKRPLHHRALVCVVVSLCLSGCLSAIKPPSGGDLSVESASGYLADTIDEVDEVDGAMAIPRARRLAMRLYFGERLATYIGASSSGALDKYVQFLSDLLARPLQLDASDAEAKAKLLYRSRSSTDARIRGLAMVSLGRIARPSAARLLTEHADRWLAETDPAPAARALLSQSERIRRQPRSLARLRKTLVHRWRRLGRRRTTAQLRWHLALHERFFDLETLASVFDQLPTATPKDAKGRARRWAIRRACLQIISQRLLMVPGERSLTAGERRGLIALAGKLSALPRGQLRDQVIDYHFPELALASLLGGELTTSQHFKTRRVIHAIVSMARGVSSRPGVFDVPRLTSKQARPWAKRLDSVARAAKAHLRAYFSKPPVNPRYMQTWYRNALLYLLDRPDVAYGYLAKLGRRPHHPLFVAAAAVFSRRWSARYAKILTQYLGRHGGTLSNAQVKRLLSTLSPLDHHQHLGTLAPLYRTLITKAGEARQIASVVHQLHEGLRRGPAMISGHVTAVVDAAVRRDPSLSNATRLRLLLTYVEDKWLFERLVLSQKLGVPLSAVEGLLSQRMGNLKASMQKRVVKQLIGRLSRMDAKEKFAAVRLAAQAAGRDAALQKRVKAAIRSHWLDAEVAASARAGGGR